METLRVGLLPVAGALLQKKKFLIQDAGKRLSI
jgi:hypothetical protein